MLSSKELLRHSKQLEAVGKISPAVAHDINNLLSGILGYSQLLLNEPAIESLKPFVEEIASASKRIAALSRILMIFSRKNQPHWEILDLNKSIQEVEKFIPPIMGPEIKFVTKLDTKLWHVKADAAQIKQMLIMLAIDSVEMLPQGGKLMLETKNFISDPQTISEEGLGSRQSVRIIAGTYGSIVIDSAMSCLPEPAIPSKIAESGIPSEIPDIDEIIRLCGGQISRSSQTERERILQITIPAVPKMDEGV